MAYGKGNKTKTKMKGKKAVSAKNSKGKVKRYKDLGGGNYQGLNSPRSKSVKKSPAYSSKKRKTTKRKYK